MANTLYAVNAATQKARATGNTVVLYNEITVTQTIGELVEALAVRKNDIVLDVKLDAVGTTSSTASVGDGGSAARFISAGSTNANALLSLSVAGALGYKYTQDDTIDITIGGAGVSGKLYKIAVTVLRDA